MTSAISRMNRLVDAFSGDNSGFGLPLGHRNYIIDGNMESVINSSASISTGGLSNAVASMYYAGVGTGGAGTLAIAAFAPGTENKSLTPPVANALNLSQTTSSTGVVGSTGPFIMQRIENAAILQGRSATFSCWLWTVSGSVSISQIGFIQNFGSGGSPSSQVTTNTAVNWTVTTTPQRFSVRIDVPSISGKTFGTNANTSYVEPVLWLPTGSTFNLVTAQWQLEQSSPQAPSVGLPTPFEYRGPGVEAIRTARYYQALLNQQIAGYAPSSGNCTTSLITFLPMRATPTATLSGQSYSNCTGLSFGPSTASAQTYMTGCTAASAAWAVFNATLDARL